ncbi:MAG: NUDIX hydrolase [Acetivibrio ethanolgignens]
MEEFKRIKRELNHKGTIIDFYTDYVEVPNGNLAKCDFIDHKGAAAIVPVDEAGNVLMVRQWRNAIDNYTLEIPAGGLNPGETDRKACAVRELEEETGYRTEYDKTEHLFDIYTTVAFSNEKIGIYYTNCLYPSKQHLDEDEFIHVERHSLEEITEMILAGKIVDNKTITSILAYKAKMGL